MLRKFIPVLALLAVPAIASAQFEAGDYELTLSGQAQAPKSVTSDVNFAAATGTIGYFTTKELEFGLQQEVTWFDSGTSTPGVDDEGWGGRTALFAQFHFDLGAFQPFIGGFGGFDYTFGAEPDDQWVAGPVGGVKYFVNGTTFIFATLSYVYKMDTPSFSEFEGNLGVGFRF